MRIWELTHTYAWFAEFQMFISNSSNIGNIHVYIGSLWHILWEYILHVPLLYCIQYHIQPYHRLGFTCANGDCQCWYHIARLVQERHNSSALAMELCLSCTNPLIFTQYRLIIAQSNFSKFLHNRYTIAYSSGYICEFQLWPIFYHCYQCVVCDVMS